MSRNRMYRPREKPKHKKTKKKKHEAAIIPTDAKLVIFLRRSSAPSFKFERGPGERLSAPEGDFSRCESKSFEPSIHPSGFFLLILSYVV